MPRKLNEGAPTEFVDRDVHDDLRQRSWIKPVMPWIGHCPSIDPCRKHARSRPKPVVAALSARLCGVTIVGPLCDVARVERSDQR